MRMLFLLVLLAIGVAAAQVPPENDNGNALLKQCEVILSPEKLSDPGVKAEFYYCAGYVDGVGVVPAMQQRLGLKTFFCAPKGITVLDSIVVVVRYLKAHEEELHKNSQSYWVLAALTEAYPCGTE